MVFRIRYIEEEYRIEIEYKRDRDTKGEYLFDYDLQIIECISDKIVFCSSYLYFTFLQ